MYTFSWLQLNHIAITYFLFDYIQKEIHESLYRWSCSIFDKNCIWYYRCMLHFWQLCPIWLLWIFQHVLSDYIHKDCVTLMNVGCIQGWLIFLLKIGRIIHSVCLKRGNFWGRKLRLIITCPLRLFSCVDQWLPPAHF